MAAAVTNILLVDPIPYMSSFVTVRSLALSNTPLLPERTNGAAVDEGILHAGRSMVADQDICKCLCLLLKRE